MIGRGGERGSGISVLAARRNDDDDVFYKVAVSLSTNYFPSPPCLTKKKDLVLFKKNNKNPGLESYTRHLKTYPSDSSEKHLIRLGAKKIKGVT